MIGLEIRPVTKTEARRFVEEHHRHNNAPPAMNVAIAVGLFAEDELVGVATAGHPVAQWNHDGFTIEINRTCIDGYHKNGNSMLYGAICRAAKAMGFRRAITYTLLDESGSSLKGAGFVVDAEFDRPPRPRSASRPRYDYDLFGERTLTQWQPKRRWIRELVHPTSEEEM